MAQANIADTKPLQPQEQDTWQKITF
jgi:hypothetical protein